MGPWSKMMTAPQFAHPQMAHMAALEGKLGGVGADDLLDKEKMLGSPPLPHPGVMGGLGHSVNPDDLAAFKALTSNEDDINGTSDLDSDAVSDNDDEVPPGNSLNSSGHSKADSGNSSGDNNTFSKSLQSSHKEIMEKLKRQEDEEREEIERELKDAQEKGLIEGEVIEDQEDSRLRRMSDEEDAIEEEGAGGDQNNSRGSCSSKDGRSSKDKENRRRRHSGESSSREVSPQRQMEIKTQRPMGLLAQHGLMTKSHSGLNLSQHHHHQHHLQHHQHQQHHHHSSGNSLQQHHHHSNNNNSSSDAGKAVGSGSIGGGTTDRAPSRGTNGELNLKVEKREREDSMEREERGVRLPMPPTAIDFTHPAFLDRQFSHPLHTQPPSPPDIGLMPNGELGTPTGGHHWTFEEQFKQLYELSEDVKRKEFLDDLFAFMQKRGTPVNRIPIMAKQPLDLYELFRLVVSKGGLVEVINKKLWREICKGLNLPSSITSAAFTLRTQYMKYLYPYECERLKLSNPGELQAAIDGNRREGRRPGYGYDFSPIPTMIPPSPHLNGGLMNGLRPIHPGPFSPGDEEHHPHTLPSPPPHLRNMAEREHMRAMEAAHHVMEEAKKRMEEVQRNAQQQAALPLTKALALSSQNNVPTSRNTSPPTSKPSSDSDGPPPTKRQALEEEVMRDRFERFMPPHIGMPSAHLKITSRNDGPVRF